MVGAKRPPNPCLASPLKGEIKTLNCTFRFPPLFLAVSPQLSEWALIIVGFLLNFPLNLSLIYQCIVCQNKKYYRTERFSSYLNSDIDHIQRTANVVSKMRNVRRFTGVVRRVKGRNERKTNIRVCTLTLSNERTEIFFTNDKGRLAPLTCHTVHQTLKSLSNSINTKARKYDIKMTPSKTKQNDYQVKHNTQQHNKTIQYVVYIRRLTLFNEFLNDDNDVHRQTVPDTSSGGPWRRGGLTKAFQQDLLTRRPCRPCNQTNNYINVRSKADKQPTQSTARHRKLKNK